jgi:spore maturation protein CgeB
VQIRDDYSDLEEKLTYYITHPDEAQQIVNHAHDYVKPFQDKKRERLISLLVFKKYLQKTGQLDMDYLSIS